MSRSATLRSRSRASTVGPALSQPGLSQSGLPQAGLSRSGWSRSGFSPLRLLHPASPPLSRSRRGLSRAGLFVLASVSLTGCGYQTWWGSPFTTGNNPNRPTIDSENMNRVLGRHVEVAPLTPEPGDIWPGPLQPEPTLQDLQNGSFTGRPEQPVPGSPLARGAQPGDASPNPARGSSTPPDGTPLQLDTPRLPRNSPPSAAVPPSPRNPVGQVYQTPRGADVTTGGGSNYQTTVTPGGGSAIVVPNGNGTSTIIHSDGRIETVTTPR